MTTRLKIRGIYSTALTRLVLNAGYAVVEPSPKIRERFDLELFEGPYDILVQDRDDLQGIELLGQPEHICQFWTFLQERLLDAVLLGCSPADSPEGLMTAVIELPGASKAFLDEIRRSVSPTLVRHHRLRITDSKMLEAAENTLLKHPEKRADLERKLFWEDIILPLEKNGVVKLEHMRPSGKPMRPREGVLVEADEDRIVFRRSFSKGQYDGLDRPIEPGDYSLTEIRDGAWYVRHSYYRRGGTLIGEYYNVNTPVEIYPYGARYLDLEVDVIRRAGEEPFLVDREKLLMLAQCGCIGSDLEAKALEVAEELIHRLQS